MHGAMDSKQGLPIIPFASRQEWEAWLEAHHATSGGLWLKIAKKESGISKASELLQQGRMKAAGLVQIEQARVDGRWEAAYEPQSSATVPDDLQRELDKNPEARAFFATLDSRNRYAILYRLQDARKPETRARRLEQYIALLNERRKLYP